MEKHKFVCSKCGAQYTLQAWKAVCPNCKSEFTLEKVADENGKTGRRPAEITAILLLAYTLYDVLLQVHPTIFRTVSYTPLPVSLAYALMIILAILVYVAAEPALWVAPIVGGAALIIGLLGVPENGPLALIPAAMGGVWAVSSTMAGLKMWRRHAHGGRDEKRLKEFSGWAGD